MTYIPTSIESLSSDHDIILNTISKHTRINTNSFNDPIRQTLTDSITATSHSTTHKYLSLYIYIYISTPLSFLSCIQFDELTIYK